MATDYSLNKTIKEEHDVACIKCSGKTTHGVLASVDVRGDDGANRNSIQWALDYQIIQCLGCKTISFREASSNSEDYYQIDDEGNTEYAVVEKVYPPRLEGYKGLGNDTHYLPTNIGLIYNETVMALSNQARVLAGIGLRALLEAVCKEKRANGPNLLSKIDDLITLGVLTPASAQILHKIRTLGNDAAHEIRPHNDKQLSLAFDIVEHLLKDVYIFPKQAETEFSRKR